MLKRRRTQKTDYIQRLALLKSGKPRLVIRRALNNIHVQVIIWDGEDKTQVEVSSKFLRKYGWKGHNGNLPAAYLTGYLAGLNAVKKSIKEANVDIGLHMSVRASSLYAAAAGARDAGLIMTVGKEAIPKMDRIKGSHVAQYAQKLSGSEKYKKQFSAYLSAGLKPEELPKHFDEVKEKIADEFGVKKVVKAEAKQ